MKTFRVLPGAEAEAREAHEWYVQANPKLGKRYIEAVLAAVRRVVESPERWREIEPGYRRYVLPRFPYSIIYAVEPDEVVIVAISHHKREPGHWRERG